MAIGEAGLDFNRNFSPPSAQERCLAAQLELAEELGLPLFLHCREAGERMAALLRERRRASPGVVHCFTGSAAELEQFLAQGLHIGITGWLCDERPERGGAALAALLPRIPGGRPCGCGALLHSTAQPAAVSALLSACRVQQKSRVFPAPDPHVNAADRLMIETDCPYLTPRSIVPSKARPQRNEPALLPHVLSAVAAARGERCEEMARQTTENARRFFRLP